MKRTGQTAALQERNGRELGRGRKEDTASPARNAPGLSVLESGSPGQVVGSFFTSRLPGVGHIG